MGEIFWLSVPSLLPSKLFCVTVSQPDVKVDNMVSAGVVDFAPREKLFNFLISSSKSPSIILALNH